MNAGRHDQRFVVRVCSTARRCQPKYTVGLAGNLGAVGELVFGFGKIRGYTGQGMGQPVGMEVKKVVRSVHRLPAKNRSEEHTSELQSRPHIVCRLLLEKKNNRRMV